MTTQVTGFFGKLPGYGDFVQRQLPGRMLDIWDNWLQHYVAASKEQLGENWLDIYLTSPVWRFAVTSGAIDHSAWLGIIIPSVDRVGRYFPFTALTAVPENVSLLEYTIAATNWYDEVEVLMLQALEEELDIDELSIQLEGCTIDYTPLYKQYLLSDQQQPIMIAMDFVEQSISSILPQLLDIRLAGTAASYSIWMTRGSERIPPCVINTKGLPGINHAVAMLDGQWEKRGWQQPYRLNENN